MSFETVCLQMAFVCLKISSVFLLQKHMQQPFVKLPQNGLLDLISVDYSDSNLHDVLSTKIHEICHKILLISWILLYRILTSLKGRHQCVVFRGASYRILGAQGLHSRPTFVQHL